MKNNIFIILAIVSAFCSLSELNAQTFIQSDLDRLINNHPFMKNYDRNSGYFKDTSYDQVDVNRLKEENASLTLELEEIKAKKSTLSQNLISSDSENDDLWNSTSELDKREKEILKAIEKKDWMINNNGLPSRIELSQVIDKMTEDTLIPLYKENQIVLNKLPRFNNEPLFNNFKGLRDFYFTKEDNILRNYIAYSYIIGSLFMNTNDLIIYQNENSKSTRIARIDLSKILALHPKMFLFDYNRIGFYKIKSINLPKDKFEEEIIKLKNEKVYDYTELDKIKEDIKNMQKTISILSIVYPNETEEDKKNKKNLKEEYSKKVKELTEKRDKIRYAMVNNDLTTIEETENILFEIEKEVLEQIEEYAKKENFEIVFNTNILFRDIQSERNRLNVSLGNIVPENYLYSLLRKHDNIISEEGLTDSTRLIRWLEILKNPRIAERVDNADFSVVLFGGEFIETQIISNIYKKYKINDNIIKSICSVLNN